MSYTTQYYPQGYYPYPPYYPYGYYSPYYTYPWYLYPFLYPWIFSPYGGHHGGGYPGGGGHGGGHHGSGHRIDESLYFAPAVSIHTDAYVPPAGPVIGTYE